MDLLTIGLFIPACFALNMIPGPNNLLAMHNAQRFGFRPALAAGMGRIIAFVLMISLAATGLAAILYASETLFLIVKLLGVSYLFWVAFQLWTSNSSPAEYADKENKTITQLMSQEFLLAAGNPKAILIFTAFLPQFINQERAENSQFLLLGGTFLSLELTAIAIYASFGLYLKQWFSKPSMRQLFNRVCATFIASIGLSLLFERKT